MNRRHGQYFLALVSTLSLVSLALGVDGGVVAVPSAPALQVWAQQIVEQHPRARAARAAMDARAADRRAADQPLHNPELEFEVERAAETAATLGVTQTLDWSDRRGARGEVAMHEHDAASAELDSARQAVAADALHALARYRATHAVVALENQRVTVLQQFADVAAGRFVAGDIGRADADLARLSLAEARLRRANAQAQWVGAAQALRTAGGSAAQAPALPGEIPTVDEGSEQLREQRLARHPEARAFHARWRAEQARARLAERERRDDPSFGVRGGKDGDDTRVGLTFTVPLSMRNSRVAEVEAANARAVAAEQEMHAAMRSLRSRLDATLDVYRALAGAWAQWRAEGQVLLTDRVALLNRLWKAGELTTTDYLVQLRETLDSEAEAAELSGTVWSAWVDWLAAAGLVNAWLNPGTGNEFTVTK